MESLIALYQGRDGNGSETELEVIESGGEGSVGEEVGNKNEISDVLRSSFDMLHRQNKNDMLHRQNKNEISDVSKSSFEMLHRLRWAGWS